MNAIVVVDRAWAIGKNNALLFSLPGDMQRFRRLTSGGTVIMGRHTLDSLPGGKGLPKRRNIVITRSENFSREGCEVASSPAEAVRMARGDENVWVIGGGSIYRALLPHCKKAYVTLVEANAAGADRFFPNLNELPEWTIEEESEYFTENGLTYRFIDYVNQLL
ncbi:MAG: dihydrofolate reductase [Oscillibacter sp.]|nr:dihydrofolate reductase [Oscillibacter sp.]